MWNGHTVFLFALDSLRRDGSKALLVEGVCSKLLRKSDLEPWTPYVIGSFCSSAFQQEGL